MKDYQEHMVGGEREIEVVSLMYSSFLVLFVFTPFFFQKYINKTEGFHEKLIRILRVRIK